MFYLRVDFGWWERTGVGSTVSTLLSFSVEFAGCVPSSKFDNISLASIKWVIFHNNAKYLQKIFMILMTVIKITGSPHWHFKYCRQSTLVENKNLKYLKEIIPSTSLIRLSFYIWSCERVDCIFYDESRHAVLYNNFFIIGAKQFATRAVYQHLQQLFAAPLFCPFDDDGERSLSVKSSVGDCCLCEIRFARIH